MQYIYKKISHLYVLSEFESCKSHNISITQIQKINTYKTCMDLGLGADDVIFSVVLMEPEKAL